MHNSAVFEIKGALCLHILAAGCTYFETCAPSVCMLFPNYKYVYTVPNTRADSRVHNFWSLCTQRVHKIKHKSFKTSFWKSESIKSENLFHQGKYNVEIL